ncbi:MAG: DnaA/Hda family protein [Alphaproteobacteria bacterium]|nr:DnaA/Hda family protein [Alphaproteobacteria bacterium]
MATSWIDRWPDWPGQYRVLNLVGPAASGKSHLAAIWSLQADAHAITELADGTAPANENLVLDNLDAGNVWNEEALFHLVNRTADGAASVLVTSEMPVAAMEWSLPDLSSRMRAVAVATLDAPDDALLRALLEKYFADRQLAVAMQVLDYMVSRMERSFVAVQTIAAAMDRRSLAEHRNLTLPLAREIMTEFADGDHARQPALPTVPGTAGSEPEED